MKILHNYIHGQFSKSECGSYLDNYCPRDGSVLGKLPRSQERDVNNAVNSALEAFPGWQKTSVEDRSRLLFKIADTLEKKADFFAEAESMDQGKPLYLAKSMDIPRAIENFRFFASAIKHESLRTFHTRSGVINYTVRSPLGVAGLISPWNLPLYLLTWKIAPALATGNTIVAKPSELTSSTAYHLAQIMDDVGLPKGVCNFVLGTGSEAGNALVKHDRVPLVSFTGGTTTGRQVALTAAPKFKKLSLELGGKNAAVVFADCDLNLTINALIRSCFLNQGEICLCTSRILVEEKIYPQFLELFLAQMKTLKVGDPLENDSFMGALVSSEHLSKVKGMVTQSLNNSCTLIVGNETPKLPAHLAKGYYFSPTLLKCQDVKTNIMQEEVFGPVVTVTTFTSFDSAMEIANGTHFGLSASVWTSNLGKAHLAASELNVGTVWINSWLVRDLRAPFGGVKNSGIGREGGDDSLHFFTEEKNVCLSFPLEVTE